MQEKQTKELFKYVIEGIIDLVQYKNRKYGNSALSPRRIFYSGKAKDSILIRLDDKVNRLFNNYDSGFAKNDIADCMGYIVLYFIKNKLGNHSNFDEIDIQSEISFMGYSLVSIVFSMFKDNKEFHDMQTTTNSILHMQENFLDEESFSKLQEDIRLFCDSSQNFNLYSFFYDCLRYCIYKEWYSFDEFKD